MIPAETIDRAKKGDLFAFEEIVCAFEKPLWSYLVRLLGNKEDAEDVVQETFVKVFKHLSTIDSSKSVKSWIYTIATNTAYDFLRKRKREATSELDDEFETNTQHPAYNNMSIEENIETKDVSSAIDRLDYLYRGPSCFIIRTGSAMRR